MTYTPYSEMSEQGLLGALLVNPQAWPLVSDKITPEDFYVPLHSRIYSAIAKLHQQRLHVWPGSVFELVREKPEEEEYHREYVTKLMQMEALGADVLSCAYIIESMSYKRKLMANAKLLVEAAEKRNTDECERLQKVIAELQTAGAGVKPDDPQEQLQAAFKLAQEPESLMPTMIPSWDETFGGLAKGVRYIIAGRAGAGKTALALNIAWNVAKQGKRVRYIFFEGRDEEIWHRIMAREMRIPITSFRKGLTQNQLLQVTRRQDLVMGKDFAVVRDPRNLQEMISRCGSCDVIVLDGISSAPASGESLIDRIAAVVAYCKTLADKTGAAVIMLAHLNSEGVKAAGSGTGIYGGQAATFDPESIIELRADEDTKGLPIRMVEGHITKNRYGELKTIKFAFQGEYMTYGDWNE